MQQHYSLNVYDLGEQNLRILNSVMKVMEETAEESLTELHDLVPSLTKQEKKRLCQIIDLIGKNPEEKYKR